MIFLDGLRVGRISSINYKKGKARVVYEDRDNCTTIELPFLTYNQNYHMPAVNDLVWVLHMPSGPAEAVILGRYWNDEYTSPDEAKQGFNRTDFSRKQGKAYVQYADPEDGEGNDGKMTVHNDDDLDVDVGGSLTVKGAKQIELQSDGSVRISGSSLALESEGTINITGGSVNISGGGSTVIDGINFASHTHAAPGGSTSPPI